MDFYKKWTFISIWIWVILFLIITFFYVKWFVILPIISDFYKYITLVLSVIWLTFWLFKFFYVIEIKDKHSDVNRIKSHYFNTLKKENFWEIINLSDNELIKKYYKDADLGWAEKAINEVILHRRK